MPPNRPHVVFDANIFVQALINPSGLAGLCFAAAREGKVAAFVSEFIIEELRDVFFRPKISTLLPDARTESVSAFISDILHVTELFAPVRRVFRLDRDPKDEPILNLAIECDADYLVTRDRDMLDLMTGIDLQSKQFRQRFRHLKIVTPREFLDFLKSREITLAP